MDYGTKDSFLIATLESFELINSKYDNSKSNGKSNIQNPDIPALIGACLYLVERIMLLYVSYQVYSHLVNECGDVIDSKYLEPNKLAILGNIIGVIANSVSLQSFIEIYKRNVDRPIFGRWKIKLYCYRSVKIKFDFLLLIIK